MSLEKRTVVVVGGTGRVGRSVASSLHDDPLFQVKVTTRDPTSQHAHSVKSSGIELIQADSWDGPQLDPVFRGAWGVYLNTNGEAPEFRGDVTRTESEQGKSVIDAAIRQNVQAFIFAGLPEAARITEDKIHIATFD